MKRFFLVIKNKRSDAYRRGVACCAAIMMLIACGTGCANKESDETAESTALFAQSAATVNNQSIETAFVSIQVPLDCLGKIQHTEIIEDNVTMEVFSMLPEDGGRELFRICFGGTGVGSHLGSLSLKDGDTPVSVVTPAYDMGTFSEKEKEAYYSMMEQLNTILSSIWEHESFRNSEAPQQTEPEITTNTVALIYWEIELPENMEYKETNADGVYKADFYGTLGGERIHLYTISLGEVSAAEALGAYMADGMTRTLGLKTHSISSQIGGMSDQKMAEYNAMMETTNDVLQVIMASENYIE